MFNKSFNNINYMSKALDGLWKRNEAINNNIANVNTPGYKKRKVEFEDELRNELINRKVELTRTNKKHIKVGNIHKKFNPQFVRENGYSTRKDGNNVNIDVEMADLAKNTMMYNSVTRQVSSEINKLRSIINEGGR